MYVNGGRLIEWRQYYKLSQADLARRTGIISTAISKAERENFIPKEALRKIASTLNITCEQLLYEDPGTDNIAYKIAEAFFNIRREVYLEIYGVDDAPVEWKYMDSHAQKWYVETFKRLRALHFFDSIEKQDVDK